jgi:hypothetical protein
MCIAILALGPGLAHAQEPPPPPEAPPPAPPPPPEQPPPGYQQAPPPGYQPPPPGYQPPPPGYQPPPPGYQQPPVYYAPPPVYYAPPPVYYATPPAVQVQPKNGVAEIIVGAIFLPLGLIFLGTSSVLWNDCTFQGGCFDPNNPNYGEAWGAVALDVFGAGMTVAGAILLPVGIVKAVKYSKWKKAHHLAWIDRVTPTLKAGANGGSLGFSLTF